MFVLLSAASVHNTWRYLIKAKLGSRLVVIFYVLAVANSIAHLCLYTTLLIYPNRDPFLFDSE